MNKIEVKFQNKISYRYYLIVASHQLLSLPCALRNPARKILGWPCRHDVLRHWLQQITAVSSACGRAGHHRTVPGHETKT